MYGAYPLTPISNLQASSNLGGYFGALLVLPAWLTQIHRALSKWRKLVQHFKSTPNPVFWSGTHNGKSVKSAADKHAKAIGGSTIGQDLKANNMKPPPRKHPLYRIWWEFVSKLKALHSTGHASAVLGSKVKKEGVWKKTEEPALMKNDKVHTISQIHPDTLKETKKLKS